MITGGNRDNRAERAQPPAAPRLYAAEELALRLERRIAERRLQPGERLGTKAEIADRYGFSGGTVNEAVILLEIRGMVEPRPGPGGGLFVASPVARVQLDLLLRELPFDPPDSADCLSVRRALEPPICFDAARNCGDSDAAELRQLLAAMRDELAETGRAPASDLRLHRRIAGMTANRLLRVVYLATLQFVEAGSDNGDERRPEEPRDEVLAVHRELVEAVIGGGRERLAQAVERHDLHAAAPAT